MYYTLWEDRSTVEIHVSSASICHLVWHTGRMFPEQKSNKDTDASAENSHRETQSSHATGSVPSLDEPQRLVPHIGMQHTRGCLQRSALNSNKLWGGDYFLHENTLRALRERLIVELALNCICSRMLEENLSPCISTVSCVRILWSMYLIGCNKSTPVLYTMQFDYNS